MTLASRRLPSEPQVDATVNGKLRAKSLNSDAKVMNRKFANRLNSKFVKVRQSSPRNALIYRRINLFLWVR